MAKIKLRILKAGRKPKAGVIRDGGRLSGKSRGEIVDLSVVLAQPHRRWSDNPRDQLLGYPLGRLHVQKYITRDQLEAGDAWASLVRTYARIMGVPVGSPQSPMTEMMAGGFYRWEADPGDEAEQERRIRRVRELYDDCFIGLAETGLVSGVGNSVLNICREICLQEVNEVVLWRSKPSQLGNLRLGLNSLWKTMGLGK